MKGGGGGPSASAPWVIEVGRALIDLIDGVLPATPDDFWFIDGLGRAQTAAHRAGSQARLTARAAVAKLTVHASCW
jgi:hypothetical protein